VTKAARNHSLHFLHQVILCAFFPGVIYILSYHNVMEKGLPRILTLNCHLTTPIDIAHNSQTSFPYTPE